MKFFFESDLPLGEHFAHLNKLELVSSSDKTPTVTITFKTTEGQTFTINQPCNEAFKIHYVNEFVRFLLEVITPDNEVDRDFVHFQTFTQYRFNMNLVNNYIKAMKPVFHVSAGIDERGKHWIKFHDTNDNETEAPTITDWLEAQLEKL